MKRKCVHNTDDILFKQEKRYNFKLSVDKCKPRLVLCVVGEPYCIALKYCSILVTLLSSGSACEYCNRKYATHMQAHTHTRKIETRTH